METDRAWALTAALLGIHQAEEVALSIRRWSDRVGPTGWRLFDEHMRRNPLAGYNPWGRAAVVAGQGAALYGLYRLTRADAARTRAVTTALTLGWGAAFCMHLGVSWRTRSFMPGTATSSRSGIVSVRSWWASAETRQIVASERRVAASTRSQSLAGASEGM